jgi:hypothetical protein
MAGSYFYHSDVGFQAVSAAGPLIVDDLKVKSPFQYDEEKIIFIKDAFAKDFTSVEEGLVATPLSWSGEAATILVNGQGGGSNNGTTCNVSLSTIDFEPGKTYRTYYIQLESRERPTITSGFAILIYGPKPSAPLYPPATPPFTLPNTTLGSLEYELHPLTPRPDYPSASEVTRTITMTVHQAVRTMTVSRIPTTGQKRSPPNPT